MRDMTVELKGLRLHGIASAWVDLVEQGGSAGLDTSDTSLWLVEHLLQAETTDRAMRSVSHHVHTAKFPAHRDLAGFDFDGSPVDRKLIHTLADCHIIETGNESYRFLHSTAVAKKRIKAREQARKGNKPEAPTDTV